MKRATLLIWLCLLSSQMAFSQKSTGVQLVSIMMPEIAYFTVSPQQSTEHTDLYQMNQQAGLASGSFAVSYRGAIATNGTYQKSRNIQISLDLDDASISDPHFLLTTQIYTSNIKTNDKITHQSNIVLKKDSPVILSLGHNNANMQQTDIDIAYQLANREGHAYKSDERISIQYTISDF